jgi:C1A family cysteine protease
MTQEAASAPPESLRLRRRQRIVFGAHVHKHATPWKEVVAEDLGDTFILDLPNDWPIHDQGERGACVAHAAVACLEYFVFRESGTLTSFSEQFIHYTMRQLQRRERIVSDRTWLRTARDVLRSDGICLESECLYDPFLGKLGLDGAEPSPAARDSAGRYRFDTTLIERPEDCATAPAAYIVSVLRKSRAVAVSIPIQVLPSSFGVTNWTIQLGRYHGIVADPTGDCPDGHAVCIIGYLQDRRPPGGGWFVCRNSWGLEWSSEANCSSQPFAIRTLPGRGYGVLSVRYVNTHVSEIMTIKEQI